MKPEYPGPQRLSLPKSSKLKKIKNKYKTLGVIAEGLFITVSIINCSDEFNKFPAAVLEILEHIVARAGGA